jgi:hypothetical protein
MVLLSGGKSLATGFALSGLSMCEFWVRYAALGGARPLSELFAYLEGNIEWPPIEHDAAAHALNEYCIDLGLGVPAAYAHEL